MIRAGAGGALWLRLLVSRNSMPSRPGSPLPSRLSLVPVLACTNRDTPKPMSCGSVSLADRKPCVTPQGRQLLDFVAIYEAHSAGGRRTSSYLPRRKQGQSKQAAHLPVKV